MGVEVGGGKFIFTACDGVGRPLDPLTIEWWHDLQEFRWGCDCPAKDNEMMMHAETCWITPIYAQLCIDSPSPPRDCYSTIGLANLSMTQSVIKCAECGREMLGRDADVIYKAPEGNIAPSPGFVWHSPERIVKAVCPHHNRKGIVSYQRQSWAGY